MSYHITSDQTLMYFPLAMTWDPKQERIALCTGNNKLYFWSVAGCVTVEVPTESEGRWQF